MALYIPPYSGLFYCIFYGCCFKRNPNDSFQRAAGRPLSSWQNLTAMFCGILWLCLSVLLSYIQSAILSGLILFFTLLCFCSALPFGILGLGMFRFGGGFLYCGLFFWDCIVSETVVCRFGLGAVGEIRVKIV